jgi:hypothetical protein
VLITKYCSSDQIKEDVKIQVAHMEVMRKILTLVGKCEGKRLLG